MNNLTQEILKRHLDYNINTGIFLWMEPTSNRAKAGSKAGVLVSDGYIRIRLMKNLYLAHRLAWLYVFGNFPNFQIDHINRNKSDNRIENLRESTVIQNAMNVGLCSRNTSGFRGVCWKASANKWVARCAP